MQLAALAFPTHPLTFAGIPLAPAMKQMETQRLTFAITVVQLLDAFECDVNQARVARQLLRGRIRKVTEQREIKTLIVVRQEVDFEFREQLPDNLLARK